MDYKIHVKKLEERSFQLNFKFDFSDIENVNLLNFISIVNYFTKYSNFDKKYLKDLGFRICMDNVFEISRTRYRVIYLLGRSDWYVSNKVFSKVVNDISFEELENIVSEINYFYNYIFKVIKLSSKAFSFNDYLKHREKIIKEEKSKVKIKFTDNEFTFYRFKYDYESRKEIFKILKSRVEGSIHHKLADYIKSPTLKPLTIKLDNISKEDIIESIREFEESITV